MSLIKRCSLRDLEHPDQQCNCRRLTQQGIREHVRVDHRGEQPLPRKSQAGWWFLVVFLITGGLLNAYFLLTLSRPGNLFPAVVCPLLAGWIVKNIIGSDEE